MSQMSSRMYAYISTRVLVCAYAPAHRRARVLLCVHAPSLQLGGVCVCFWFVVSGHPVLNDVLIEFLCVNCGHW